jgi:hypothetical protein
MDVSSQRTNHALDTSMNVLPGGEVGGGVGTAAQAQPSLVAAVPVRCSSFFGPSCCGCFASKFSFGEWSPRDPCAATFAAVLNLIPGLGTLFFCLTKGSWRGCLVGLVQLQLFGVALSTLGYYSSPMSDICYGMTPDEANPDDGLDDGGWCCLVSNTKCCQDADNCGCSDDDDCVNGNHNGQCITMPVGTTCACNPDCASNRSGQCAFDPADNTCEATDQWNAIDANQGLLAGQYLFLSLGGALAIIAIWAWSWSFAILMDAYSAVLLRAVPTLERCESIVCLLINCVCPGVGTLLAAFVIEDDQHARSAMSAGTFQLLLLATPGIIIGVCFALASVLTSVAGWSGDTSGFSVAGFRGVDVILVVAWLGWVPSLCGWLWAVTWAYRCLKHANQASRATLVAAPYLQQPLMFNADAAINGGYGAPTPASEPTAAPLVPLQLKQEQQVQNH